MTLSVLSSHVAALLRPLATTSTSLKRTGVLEPLEAALEVLLDQGSSLASQLGARLQREMEQGLVEVGRAGLRLSSAFREEWGRGEVREVARELLWQVARLLVVADRADLQPLLWLLAKAEVEVARLARIPQRSGQREVARLQDMCGHLVKRLVARRWELLSPEAKVELGLTVARLRGEVVLLPGSLTGVARQLSRLMELVAGRPPPASLSPSSGGGGGALYQLLKAAAEGEMEEVDYWAGELEEQARKLGSREIEVATSRLVRAARIVCLRPGSEVGRRNLEEFRRRWQEEVRGLLVGAKVKEVLLRRGEEVQAVEEETKQEGEQDIKEEFSLKKDEKKGVLDDLEWEVDDVVFHDPEDVRSAALLMTKLLEDMTNLSDREHMGRKGKVEEQRTEVSVSLSEEREQERKVNAREVNTLESLKILDEAMIEKEMREKEITRVKERIQELERAREEITRKRDDREKLRREETRERAQQEIMKENRGQEEKARKERVEAERIRADLMIKEKGGIRKGDEEEMVREEERLKEQYMLRAEMKRRAEEVMNKEKERLRQNRDILEIAQKRKERSTEIQMQQAAEKEQHTGGHISEYGHTKQDAEEANPMEITKSTDEEIIHYVTLEEIVSEVADCKLPEAQSTFNSTQVCMSPAINHMYLHPPTRLNSGIM